MTTPKTTEEQVTTETSKTLQPNREIPNRKEGKVYNGRRINPLKKNNELRNKQPEHTNVIENGPLSNNPIMDIKDLRLKGVPELNQFVEQNNIELPISLKGGKSELVFIISKFLLKQGQKIKVEGVLQMADDANVHGYGFLRTPGSYQVSVDDIYVPNHIIKKFHLRTGDTVLGTVRYPRENERYLALTDIESINFGSIEKAKNLVPFRDLTADFPTEWLRLEQADGTAADLIGRMIDLIAPLGKGQRSLIVAPPKAGKTVMMQRIAKSILANNPEVYLIVLLIDERPEEVTDFIRNIKPDNKKSEVIASTFDEMPTSHVQKAELTLAKAKRLANNGFDVVILLDSMTRLARAYNAVTPPSGKVLTGGLDSNALQRPKKFFGAARNIAEGGSLTIIASALIETGSKMDEVILEEFGGTGNNDIRLARELSQRNLYPAIDINSSSTRRADQLLPVEYIKSAWILRKCLQGQDKNGALEFLLEKMKATKSNIDLFQTMRSQ